MIGPSNSITVTNAAPKIMIPKSRAPTKDDQAKTETFEIIRKETRSKNKAILSTDKYKNTLWQFTRLLVRNIHYVASPEA